MKNMATMLSIVSCTSALYGGQAAERLFLHAWRLRLNHPLSGAPLELLAPLPRELQSFLDTLSA